MDIKSKILDISGQKGIIRSSELTDVLGVSRQYVTQILGQLVQENKLIKIGSTKMAAYATEAYLENYPEISGHYHRKFKTKGIEEHKILDDIVHRFSPYKKLPENIKSIFDYAFLEMLNNALEHSQSGIVDVTVGLDNKTLMFVVDDLGIGVYRNIMKKRELHDELEAIQDLLKGKVTTAPKLHSGEGIFFTSKVGDEFILDSFGYQYIANNKIDDVFVGKVRGHKKGTKVTFRIDLSDKHHLNDIFKRYTDHSKGGNYGFDKTEIRVRLYSIGGVNISRSQARRVTAGLDKFKVVVMDYDKVPMIGQAFADEIYRVFQGRHPGILIQNENMSEGVAFMVEHAKSEAKVGRD